MLPDLHQLVASMFATAGRGQYPRLRWLFTQDRPSAGLCHLQGAGVLRLLPELEALVGAPQDPRWHPEGDVWTHTLLVVDQAASLRGDLEARQQEILITAALCHDLGKPLTTARHGARVRALGHECAGEAPTRSLLARLDAPGWLTAPVCALVRHHLAPVHFVRQGAKARAYRRLAQKLVASGATVPLLLLLSRADQLGRGTSARSFEEGDTFEARWRAATQG